MRRWFPSWREARRRRCGTFHPMIGAIWSAWPGHGVYRGRCAASYAAPASGRLPMRRHSSSFHRRRPDPWPAVLCPAPGPTAINPSALRPNHSSKVDPGGRHGRTTHKATASFPGLATGIATVATTPMAVLEERIRECPICLNVLKTVTTPQPI